MNSPIKSYSQSGEDIIINFLAKHVLHIDNIYYLDLGSNDPVHFNNTYSMYLDGHRGVSVDANPQFTKLYEKYREHDKFVNCGVGTKNGKIVFYQIEPDTLSTFSESTANSYTANGTHQIVGKKKISVLTVDRIIKKYCDRIPNILSVDIEGLDFEIIKSIDFKKWKPSIICAETLGYSADASGLKLQNIIDHLIYSGYLLYADTYINSIFVSKEAWNAK